MRGLTADRYDPGNLEVVEYLKFSRLFVGICDLCF